MVNRISAINYSALPQNMQDRIRAGMIENPNTRLVYIKLNQGSSRVGWIYEFVTEADRNKGLCSYLEKSGYVCVLGINNNGREKESKQ